MCFLIWQQKKYARNFVARIRLKFFKWTFLGIANKKCQVKNFDLFCKKLTLFSSSHCNSQFLSSYQKTESMVFHAFIHCRCDMNFRPEK